MRFVFAKHGHYEKDSLRANQRDAAKLSPLASLHSSRPQRSALALQMVERMDGEGFGACSDHRECEAVCPKGIPASLIAAVNSNYLAVAVDRIKKVFLPRSERGE